jgi:redox-regulated HSP33 family molecular chaperone
VSTAPPRQRRRARRRLRLLVVVGLLSAVALAASGCQKTVSAPLLENLIGNYYASFSGVRPTVRCPEGKAMKTQNDFFCFTDVHGAKGYVLVIQKDDYGRVVLSHEHPLDPADVEADLRTYLRTQHQLVTKVHCPDNVINQPDQNFTCTAGSVRVAVNVTDGFDHYTFNLLPTKGGSS